jgi:hypothetical protein
VALPLSGGKEESDRTSGSEDGQWRGLPSHRPHERRGRVGGERCVHLPQPNHKSSMHLKTANQKAHIEKKMQKPVLKTRRHATQLKSSSGWAYTHHDNST